MAKRLQIQIQHELRQGDAHALAYERFAIEATEIICRILKKRNISRTELARRMGVHQVQVTKMLAGQKRVGIRSLSKAFHALGYSMHVGLGPATEGVRIPEFLRMEDDP